MLISPLKSRQSSAVLGTCLTFSLLWLVQFVACTWTPVRCRRCHDIPEMDFWGLTNCHLVLQELWSFLFVDLCCVQFVSTRHLLIPVFICVFCGDCTNFGYSQYHQSPVRLCRSRFNPGDHALPFLEYGRVESPPSVNSDPDLPKPGDWVLVRWS